MTETSKRRVKFESSITSKSISKSINLNHRKNDNITFRKTEETKQSESINKSTFNRTVAGEKEGRKNSAYTNLDKSLVNFNDGLNSIRMKNLKTTKEKEKKIEYDFSPTKILNTEENLINEIGGNSQEFAQYRNLEGSENKTNNTNYWEFEIKNHPKYVLKYLGNVYNRYNISIKDLGMDVYELNKDKVRIHCMVVDEGHRKPKKLSYRLEQGSVQKARELMEKIFFEINVMDEAKKRNTLNFSVGKKEKV